MDSIIVKDAKNFKFTSQRLDGLLNVKELSDVTFLVEGEEIHASRLILVAVRCR
jgi:hypothetical protein